MEQDNPDYYFFQNNNFNNENFPLIEQHEYANMFQYTEYQDNLENNFLFTELFNQYEDYPVNEQLDQYVQHPYLLASAHHQISYDNYQHQIIQEPKQLELQYHQEVQAISQKQKCEEQTTHQKSQQKSQKIQKPISKQSKKQKKASKICTKKSQEISSSDSLSENEFSNEFNSGTGTSSNISDLKKSVKETKNLVKDFSNAICKFLEVCTSDKNDYFYGFYELLYKELEGNEEQIQEFKRIYVNYKIHMKNIQSFQDIFAQKVNEKYIDIFLKVIKLFFEKYAIFYIYTHSKMSDESKLAHSKYIHKFLDGIQNPERFTHFK